jgi:uncharacterized protein (TIGR02246 family)
MRILLSAIIVAGSLLVSGCGSSSCCGTQAPASAAVSRSAPSEQEIAALFDRWNESLKSGDPQKVVANYAEQSILLPTLSNKPRLTQAEKADYFHHFLENGPSGTIDMRQIQIGADMAVDTGLYTFRFAKTGDEVKARYSFTYRRFSDQWLIVSHHSSAMPEK